jgi:hypothetical protein
MEDESLGIARELRSARQPDPERGWGARSLPTYAKDVVGPVGETVGEPRRQSDRFAAFGRRLPAAIAAVSTSQSGIK